ncbi:HpcH/HpaI aldolase/citrate lyase family protein [Leifsonia sp. SIMBA_070]|uniref:HpcH/HpaI aldolase/citrate lyase family protein n=1 Tax=Leifsonia sp. SIMBA_070 TaxID=3085810 RepID=UPI00397B9B4F
MTATTALYVPGDRPDRFEKAVAAGPDIVILDLEDAVAADAKRAALDAVTQWLAERGGEDGPDEGPVVQVRINPGADHELAALVGTGAGFGLRVPKVESAADLDAIAERAPGHPLTALIESALGLERAFELASHPAVVALGAGESDLAAELRTRDQAVVDHIRIRLLIAACAAGLPAPMLAAYSGIRDLDGLRADTERGRSLGWYGRSAVHPAQLPVIRSVFEPRDEELRWARAVLDALASGGVATLADGQMVDAAMAVRARGILGR